VVKKGAPENWFLIIVKKMETIFDGFEF